MAEVASYSHFTALSVSNDAWDEAWLGLISWKGYLQSFPGHISTWIAARAFENGDVRVYTKVTWELIEQLEEWIKTDFTVGKLLLDLDPPAFDIVEDTLEDFST